MDEAHERSINTDVILGLLKRDAPKFPNLKVCVTSATIETQLFRDFFGQAACLDSPGRMYPVVIKHMPIPDSDDLSQPVISAVLRILDETASAAAAASCNVGLNMPGDDEQVQSPGDLSNKGGDVLVFLTGQVGTSGCACLSNMFASNMFLSKSILQSKPGDCSFVQGRNVECIYQFALQVRQRLRVMPYVCLQGEIKLCPKF